MKVKQKNIRVFEIECEEVSLFESYIEKNSVLFTGFLLLLTGDKKIECGRICETKGIGYAIAGEAGFDFERFDKISKSAYKEREHVRAAEQEAAKKELLRQEIEATIQKSKLNEEPEILIDSEKAVLVDKNLRSGEEIKADSDVIVIGRINSGATVETSKNAVILDAVDGDVRVEGDFIIIKTIKKGSVMLKGILLDKEMLDGELKMAFYKDGITYRGIK